jgi:NAD(P)H-hydrate epimerase
MLNVSIEEIQKDRIKTATLTAREWNSIVVLKGAYTVIAHPGGEAFVNPTGNPGMASGGVGDVLTGVIAGLLGQGLSPFEASVCGVYLHGMGGDVVASIKGQHGLIASDMVDALPYVIESIVHRKAS